MQARGGRPAPVEATTYEAMYAQYHPRLVAYCRRRLWNEADAEDAAHETLLRAFRALPDFDPTSDAWPWLMTIAGRICTDLRRRAARAPSGPQPDNHDADVHDEVVRRLRADIVDDALRELPAHYRTPLVLREYGGWSYDDIARVQGKSVGSVRSLLTRSRRRLEAQVEAVARGRGQWPLPGTVPSVRRLHDHLRAWREELVRSPHVLVAGALEASSAAGRWVGGTGASLAGAMTFATAALGSLLAVAAATPPPPPGGVAAPAVTWQVRSPEIHGLHTTPVAAVPVGVGPVRPPRESLTRLEATTPVPDDYDPGVGADGSAGVDETPGVLWISYSETVRVPGGGEYTVSSGTVTTPCKGEVRGLVCSTVRTASEHSPG